MLSSGEALGELESRGRMGGSTKRSQEKDERSRKFSHSLTPEANSRMSFPSSTFRNFSDAIQRKVALARRRVRSRLRAAVVCISTDHLLHLLKIGRCRGAAEFVETNRGLCAHSHRVSHIVNYFPLLVKQQAYCGCRSSLVARKRVPCDKPLLGKQGGVPTDIGSAIPR